MSGISSDYTFGNVQTFQSFFPPFSAQGKAMATVSHGNPIVLAVATANGGQGIDLLGNMNSTNPYYGMGSQASVGPGALWVGVQALVASPALNTWYTLTIGVNVSGVATVSIANGSTVYGTVSYYVGVGQYYLFLGQFINAPPVTGPNSASWSSVTVNQTAPPVPGPHVLGVIADPARVTVGNTTALDVLVSGGVLPLAVAYTQLPSGCTTRSTLTLSCTPTATGNYTILATVTDANGHSSTGEANLTVIPTPAPPSAPAAQITPIVGLSLGLGAAGLIVGAVAVLLASRLRQRSNPPGGAS